MSILDRAKSHFENIGVQSIEVPEWKDEDGKPTVIYWNPINLFEKNKLYLFFFQIGHLNLQVSKLQISSL